MKFKFLLSRVNFKKSKFNQTKVVNPIREPVSHHHDPNALPVPREAAPAAGGSNCFAGDALVITKDTNFKKMKDVKTGDVVSFNAIALDKKGNELKNMPVEFSFTGKSFDKSNLAYGLILEDVLS